LKHAVQHEMWVPTCSRTEEDHGEPWSSWQVAGPSECKLITSQQSGIYIQEP
jgi:hypothetical protein